MSSNFVRNESIDTDLEYENDNILSRSLDQESLEDRDRKTILKRADSESIAMGKD